MRGYFSHRLCFAFLPPCNDSLTREHSSHYQPGQVMSYRGLIIKTICELEFIFLSGQPISNLGAPGRAKQQADSHENLVRIRNRPRPCAD
jgi:hypothetical protein